MNLTLTGRLRENHYRIHVGEKPALLSYEALAALIELVHGAITSETGLVEIARLAVHRLRQSLDRQIGPGTGRQLIETAGGGSYRLAIPKSQIRKRVFLTPCFRQLNDRHVVNPDHLAILRKRCGKRKLPDA